MKNCFVIGGGTSVTKILNGNYNLLKDYDVIVTNNGYEYFPNAKAVVFADEMWYLKNKENLLNFSGEKIMCINHNFKKLSNDANITKMFHRGVPSGLGMDGRTLHGCNSGHIAINYAVFKGYKNIFLLGFDMDSKSQSCHYYPEHSNPSRVSLYDTSFIPNLKTLVPLQKTFDFKIWNLNTESAITFFDYIKLENCL